MDPVACIAELLTEPNMESASALRTYYYKGGYKPLLSHVKAEVIKRGARWTVRRQVLAVAMGAV